MIREAIRRFYEDYYSSVDFREWQNNLSKNIYSSLALNLNSGEVQTVTDLCDVMSNKHYKGLYIESQKIHSRSTSGVMFDYVGNQLVTTELADMVIISIVTFDRQVVLLKTAFIQNKKAYRNQSWSINHEQLFLLKNFPTFTGVSGIFKDKTITFINHSNTLGNYGLFSTDGEMTFLTARNVFCNQKSISGIKFCDIKSGAADYPKPILTYNYCTHYKNCCNSNDFHWLDYSNYCNLPFFGNYSYALDVHEIVRELTYFNIGEPSSAFGRITDDMLYDYTNKTLQSAFGYTIGENYFNRDNRQNMNMINDDRTVILNHVELKK